ncbi:hypothetical protein CNMCM8927_004950 [Aspergillus lentulus]|uniref:Uncharacterized protein n=1 Tax=Aspergillus lentulus TaxID=293939 RepID=A0AAN5YZV7_ASPLE|nr:hypothetical protein CNMCM8927_004950 [Aspergillus lentulus]
MGLRPSKKKRREEAIRRQERQDLCREGGLEPQLRPNLTKAQLLQVEELHHEFQLRKRVREEAKDALEAAKKAFEKAEEEWKAADDAVKASSLERRQYYMAERGVLVPEGIQAWLEPKLPPPALTGPPSPLWSSNKEAEARRRHPA